MCPREFVERLAGRLADNGRHQGERAGVVEEGLSRRRGGEQAEDVATRVGRHVHARLVVVLSGGRSRLDPLQTHRHGESVLEKDAVLLGRSQVGQLGKEAEDRLVDAADEPAIHCDPDGERRHALRSRLQVVQRVGTEGDRFHLGTENRVRDLVDSLEVALEQQIAAASDNDSMNLGVAQGCEPIGQPAQGTAVDERVVIERDNGPAVVSRDRNTSARHRKGLASQLASSEAAQSAPWLTMFP